MDVLLKHPHGLGDAAQFTCVPQHLAKCRPDWKIDIASHVGKHSAFRGLCRRSWILDREVIPEHNYQVFDLGWYECYSVYSDSPCTKVCNCLREVFGIVPDLSLLKYRIEVCDEDRAVTRRYLEEICAGKVTLAGRVAVAELAQSSGPTPGDSRNRSGANETDGLNSGELCDETNVPGSPEDRLPVVAIHYEGNTSSAKKNLPHHTVRALCGELLSHGYTPLILDWDCRSPLPDQRTIFRPHVGPGDLWGNTGTGDAGRLAALISQCALMIGVDSGPLHVAGATETPTLGVWTGHSPLQFYDLCPNVTHLVPERWRTIPPCQNDAAARFFTENYAYRTYRGPDDLESAVIGAALETLAGWPRRPDRAAGSRRRRDKRQHHLGPIGKQSPRSLSRESPVPVTCGADDVGFLSLRDPAGAPHTAGPSVELVRHLQKRFAPNHISTSLQEENLMTTANPAALTWQQIPGLAREIVLGADDSAWCLGTGETPGGFSIHRWDGPDWEHIAGAATKIAVGPQGTVWTIDRDHRVVRSHAAGWEALPGLAREIACGADGSVWCVSAGDIAPGGGSIHVWNGGDWDHVEGAAVKIAPDPDGQPWIVNSAGQVFRRSGEGWELLPGLASEIACGSDGSVWCLSASVTDGNHSIHVWNGSDWEHVPALRPGSPLVQPAES